MCKFQNLCKGAIVILSWKGLSALAAIYDSDGSSTNIQSIHDTLAQNGDTITLPPGTFTWSAGVTITKAIMLQGQGVSATIVIDDVQSPNRLISFELVAGNLSRLTGIEFQDGGRTTYLSGNVFTVGSNTNGSQFRMDHCKWAENVNGSPLFDTVIGVVDHNVFVRGTQNAEDGHCFRVYGSHWDNGGGYGDGSWTAPTNFGSSQFLFFEDNTFTSNHPSYLIALCDAYNGARFVMRHNTIYGFTYQNHGTESSGRLRGSRATEFYNNNCDGKNLNQFVGGSRSGSQVIHDNICVNFWGGGTWNLNNYRSYATFPVFGGADGTNPWDVNDPTVYFTGTAAQNSSGTTVTVSGSPNWTINRWVGYVVRRTTNLCNVTNANAFGLIVSNTGNTLTWIPNAYTGLAALSVCSGDGLEIRRVIQAMDMPGRALGSLLPNVFQPTPPPGWNDQVTEPVYQWNNGAMHIGTNGVPSIHEGEHYFNNVPMPGYTPYVYPHPLVTDEPTPSPTPSATVMPSPTPTPTSTLSPSPPPSPTPTATATPISPSPTPTATVTAISTPTPTSTPSATPTTTATPTATPTPTATATPRHTPKPHPSHAPYQGWQAIESSTTISSRETRQLS
jgi:hypothetical protein